ncbi:hypothetical protein EVAR_85416_1 [Eumeta japonica]|uniref:Uncharacterized protein n=1 Tax=Eumeta variegata TaxID=151549 RepID=A0A4C1WM54_EUMVA|nr:hypothetical protein EVAR_85416_1 [Eumeta japonica]
MTYAFKTIKTHPPTRAAQGGGRRARGAGRARIFLGRGDGALTRMSLRHRVYFRCVTYAVVVNFLGCGWESLMKNVTLGNVTMSHRTRERPAECLASLSHSTMIGLPRARAALEN